MIWEPLTEPLLLLIYAKLNMEQEYFGGVERKYYFSGSSSPKVLWEERLEPITN
jgi:hypothetical protein